jgi:tetratricopeptide (TPR) repeat protein
LMAMANLAATYRRQGRWDEAVVLEEKVLEVRTEVFGERHPDTLMAMANLASTYRHQGRWDEAVVLQEKVLEVSKEVLGERHPHTLMAMANLKYMREYPHTT